MTTHLTIGAVARLADVPAKTIRFYEEAGVLPEAGRSESGYRLYTEDDVRRIRLIRRARILGLGLREIKELADLAFAESCRTFEEELLRMIDRRLVEIDRTIADLVALKDDLGQLKASLTTTAACEESCRADECSNCRFIDD